MGLDTTHDAFHGAYSAFNRFRQFVLKSIGGSWPPHEDKTLDPERWYWDDEKFDLRKHEGLWEFFTHSDCDGEISPEMCVKVADELESILPHIEELAKSEDANGHIARDGGFVAVTHRFIAGCRLAAERNEPLEFH